MAQHGTVQRQSSPSPAARTLPAHGEWLRARDAAAREPAWAVAAWVLAWVVMLADLPWSEWPWASAVLGGLALLGIDLWRRDRAVRRVARFEAAHPCPLAGAGGDECPHEFGVRVLGIAEPAAEAHLRSDARGLLPQAHRDGPPWRAQRPRKRSLEAREAAVKASYGVRPKADC